MLNFKIYRNVIRGRFIQVSVKYFIRENSQRRADLLSWDHVCSPQEWWSDIFAFPPCLCHLPHPICWLWNPKHFFGMSFCSWITVEGMMNTKGVRKVNWKSGRWKLCSVFIYALYSGAQCTFHFSWSGSSIYWIFSCHQINVSYIEFYRIFC